MKQSVEGMSKSVILSAAKNPSSVPSLPLEGKVPPQGADEV